MLEKSYCCECQQEFTKGDIVTKYKSKTFWAGLPGFQSCLAPYANRHQLAKFWPKKRATEAANGMVYENRLDRYVTKAANRFIASLDCAARQLPGGLTQAAELCNEYIRKAEE